MYNLNMQTINNLYPNTLIIPDGIKKFDGVQALFKAYKNSTIIYKELDYELLNVEFYTQSFCIVFSCGGVERITSYDFRNIDISKDQMLFLPKDIYLISDFFKQEKTLKAFLFFFDDELIEKFLAQKKFNKKLYEKKAEFYIIEVNNSIKDYMQNLKSVCKNQYNSKEFLELKLLELLYLIDANDKNKKLLHSLFTLNKDKNKRNISLIMKRHFLSNFTLEDFALLSGRSLSSFHRDFKRQHNITPKQYLINLKLEYAKEALKKENISVSDIASKIGYENLSHFIKAFKSKFGFTPKQFSKTLI